MKPQVFRCPLCSIEPQGSVALQLHLQRHHQVPADRADELTTEAELGIPLSGVRRSGSVCAAASAADPKKPRNGSTMWPLPTDLQIILAAIPNVSFAKVSLPGKVLLQRAVRSLKQANEGTRAEFAKQLARALDSKLGGDS